jgi:hypothetical protein
VTQGQEAAELSGPIGSHPEDVSAESLHPQQPEQPFDVASKSGDALGDRLDPIKLQGIDRQAGLASMYKDHCPRRRRGYDPRELCF